MKPIQETGFDADVQHLFFWVSLREIGGSVAMKFSGSGW